MDLKNALPAPLVFTCPACKAKQAVFLHGLSRFVVCNACWRAYARDSSTGFPTERRRYRARTYKPYLTPGDEGELSGRRYLVTGWVSKREKGNSCRWAEYHLFNPVHGFAQLSVFEGHWTFHEQLRVYPRETGINETLIFQRNAYEPYNSYECVVGEAEGEFAYDLSDDQHARIKELVAPPYMLTRELGPDELAWYSGLYLEPAEVRKAFNKTAEPPARSGVGAAQPMKLAIGKDVLLTVSSVAAVIILLTQFALAIFDGPTIAHEGAYMTSVDSTGRMMEIESRSFTLARGRGAVELTARPLDLDNNWFELSGALINESTGETRSFSFNIEYYHGFEGGERWSEGRTSDGMVFSALPSGTYHMAFYPTFDKSRPVRGFDVRLEAAPTLWSNMWLVLLLAMAFPLITWYRISRFEANRWSE